MDISHALARLNSQLPLKARQDKLSPELKVAHQSVLRSLVNNARPPSEKEMAQLLGRENVERSLQKLMQDDLIVLDATEKNVVGAYPVTIEQTPHHVRVHDHSIYAMCALDAVSVAPMFNTQVEINSLCHMTETAISMEMNGYDILNSQPSSSIRVGVRWQMPTGAAAHSMCLEMVFLLDEQVALQWQNGDTENKSLFTLHEAVAFGSEFFVPLLK